MRIDGPGIVLVGGFLVAATSVALALFWDRLRRWGRGAIVAGCVLSVAFTAAAQLNRMAEVYPTWSALTGVTAAAVESGKLVDPLDPQPANGAKPTTTTNAPELNVTGPKVTKSDGSAIVVVKVNGKLSHMSAPMYVYLPRGYGRDPHMRYPVIEATHGFPGSPRTWINRLDIQGWLDQEINAGRMAPTVVLLPYQTPRSLTDTECTNLAFGPKSETFLTEDVPAYAKAHFKIRTDRAGWGLIGYSAGGYCAINLTLKHAGEYAAGASLSGYDNPGIKIGDGSENTVNNDIWRLTNLPQPNASLYLAWAADDPWTRRAAGKIIRAATAPLAITTAVLAHGGHSDAAWEEMEAPAFDWLSAHLARPAAIG